MNRAPHRAPSISGQGEPFSPVSPTPTLLLAQVGVGQCTVVMVLSTSTGLDNTELHSLV